MYTALISGCQGLGTAFSNTFVSLKLAQKVVSKSAHNFYQRASMLTKIPKIHIYSLKTLDARALGLHFQHLNEPETCPEGAIKMYQ